MELVTKRSSSSEESPNWLELPPEVTAAILLKVGVVDILNNVQLVCTYWHTICKDPSMWRSIDMLFGPGCYELFDVEKMASHAVDRSCGQLVDISVGHFPTDGIIHYLAQRSCQLRRLRIVWCCFTKDLLKEIASKFPTLEELEVQKTPLSVAAVEAIGHCCPRLKTFRFKPRAIIKYIHGWAYRDDLPKIVAKIMPKLHHLELRTSITNDGLKAILNGCPCLETLDLCSSYLCDLQVDDLGKVYSARYKKIVRYHEEPAVVNRNEQEYNWYDNGFYDYDDDDEEDDDDYYDDDVYDDDDDVVDYDDDDDDDGDDVVYYDDDDNDDDDDADDESGTHEQW
ncbi:unnamed protein product [Rhodiola kirilowii]